MIQALIAARGRQALHPHAGTRIVRTETQLDLPRLLDFISLDNARDETSWPPRTDRVLGRAR